MFERQATISAKARALICAFAVLTLSACANMPQFPTFGGEFSPLDSEVAEVAAPYAPAAPAAVGDALCRIGKGEARFTNGWFAYGASDFSLPPNATSVDIPVSAKKGGGLINLEGYYDPAGQKMIFCPSTQGLSPDARVACFSLYMLEDDLVMGLERTFDVPDAVRGAAITCAFDAGHLQKL